MGVLFLIMSGSSCANVVAGCVWSIMDAVWVTIIMDTVFGILPLSLATVFICTYTMPNSLVDLDWNLLQCLCAGAAACESDILKVAACLRRHTFLSRRLVCHVLYGGNHVHIVFVTFTYGNPFFTDQKDETWIIVGICCWETSAFDRRSLSESVHNSDDPDDRQPDTILFEDVLVLRCICVLYA